MPCACQLLFKYWCHVVYCHIQTLWKSFPCVLTTPCMYTMTCTCHVLPHSNMIELCIPWYIATAPYFVYISAKEDKPFSSRLVAVFIKRWWRHPINQISSKRHAWTLQFFLHWCKSGVATICSLPKKIISRCEVWNKNHNAPCLAIKILKLIIQSKDRVIGKWR